MRPVVVVADVVAERDLRRIQARLVRDDLPVPGIVAPRVDRPRGVEEHLVVRAQAAVADHQDLVLPAEALVRDRAGVLDAGLDDPLRLVVVERVDRRGLEPGDAGERRRIREPRAIEREAREVVARALP
jgi:hypothetical protein